MYLLFVFVVICLFKSAPYNIAIATSLLILFLITYAPQPTYKYFSKFILKLHFFIFF